jgi:hypothetical protein
VTQEQIQYAQLWASIAVAVTGALSFVALVVYVIKTWQIASETKRSAIATEAAANATAVAAESARGQLEELQRTRDVGIQPYLHVVYAQVETNMPLVAESGLRDIWLNLHVINLGRGPALSVRASVAPDWLPFNSDAEPKNLLGDGGTTTLTTGVAKDANYENALNTLQPTPLILTLRKPDHSQMSAYVEVQPDDHGEVVQQVSNPSIQPTF